MALFRVDAEHRCIDRWLEIQTENIGGFFLELRIVTGNIAAQSMRLEPSFDQDARYPHVVGAHFGGNLASRPMRRAIIRFTLSPTTSARSPRRDASAGSRWGPVVAQWGDSSALTWPSCLRKKSSWKASRCVNIGLS